MGRRITGIKPAGVRRRSAKTDGASGKETRIITSDPDHNIDRAVRQRTAG